MDSYRFNNLCTNWGLVHLPTPYLLTNNQDWIVEKFKTYNNFGGAYNHFPIKFFSIVLKIIGFQYFN